MGKMKKNGFKWDHCSFLNKARQANATVKQKQLFWFISPNIKVEKQKQSSIKVEGDWLMKLHL